MSTTPENAPVALVTGADKGIGLETVRRLVEAGYAALRGVEGSNQHADRPMARLLPHIGIDVADPGMTATDPSGGDGHSVHDGELPW